jgi:6-phosphogluconate dehydrogenase
MAKSDIGLYGLAVMGQNLVLNMARNGFQVTAGNRTATRTEEFMAGPAADATVMPTYDIGTFVESLERPRAVMIMVKSGPPVDAVIAAMREYLEPGDLIIDGGNSHYTDTERRIADLAEDGIGFLGVGISGGEEGALWGPSIMPGGEESAYRRVEPIFEAIAANVEGSPCVTYLGPRGAGHYVKMVHNGIEYGFMQLIAEAYDLLHRGLGMSNEELHETFALWSEGPLSSFLIEITADIFARADDAAEGDLIDIIVDKAKQKGTGKWTSQQALDLGIPIPTITAGVDARILSSLKDQRIAAADVLPGPDAAYSGDRETFIQAVHDALHASVITAYAQGLSLLQEASQEYDYGLDLAEVARIWRGGCIIRAGFLEDIRQAYADDPALANLMLAPAFCEVLTAGQDAWRHVVGSALGMGIPTPAMAASLAYYDSYRTPRLPANLIQAQRDYFGAHTYERLDQEGTFHTEWTD